MSDKTVVKVINWLLYGMVLLVPLIFVNHSMFPFVVPKTALFQALAEIIIVLWLGLAIFYKKYRPRITPLLVATGAFLGILTIAGLAGSDVQVSLWSTPDRALGLIALWHFALLFLALSSLSREINWRAVWVVTLGTSILASLGALLSFNGAIQNFLIEGAQRPGSTFSNPTFLAGYLLFNFFLALLPALMDKKESWSWRTFGLAAAVINGLAILDTQTRGDILGVFVGIVILLVFLSAARFKPFSRSRSLTRNAWLYLLVALILLTAVFAVTYQAPFWQRIPGLSRATGNDVSVDARFLVWKSGIQGFLQKPVLGWGWENFNLAFEAHYSPKLLEQSFANTYFDEPHNLFIEYAVTAGILGLLAFLAFLGAAVFEMWRLKEQERVYAWVFLAVLTAYAVRSFFIFDTIGTYLMLFVILAFVDGMYRHGSSHHLAAAAGESDKHSGSKRSLPVVIAGSCIVGLGLIYFLSWPAAHAMYVEYNGPNDYLLQQFQPSVDAFNAALAVPYSPYRDETRSNFADVVEEAASSGVAYPNIVALQAMLAGQLQQIITDHPHDYFNYIYLAEFENQFYQLNPSYLKDAETLEQEALTLSPGRQQVYYTIAKTELLENNVQGALGAFQAAVNLDPNAGDPHFYLGLIYYQLGNTQQGDAEIARAKALGRVPQSAQEAVAVGTYVGDLENNYAESIQYYLQALSFPGNTVAFQDDVKFKLALAYYYNNQYPQAAALFTDIAQRNDFRLLPIYPQLEPILEQLHVSY